ncbi:MAG: hypothetical protein AAFV53_25825 [Myxococcota bacterium]
MDLLPGVDLNDEADLILLRSFFSTTAPGVIRAEMEGQGGGTLFCLELSVGAVAGLHRDDGPVALKRFASGTDPAHIAACHALQRHLFASGFPCPEPLQLLSQPLAWVERWDTRGAWVDGNQPAWRARLAALLARQVDLSRSFVAHFPPRRGAGKLWPEPHNALFDFSRPHPELDGIRARIPAPGGEEVVAHLDWSAKHFRHVGEQISVVYDWDSVQRVPEAAAVGQAALDLPATHVLDVRQQPTFEEMAAFRALYPRPVDERSFWRAIVRGQAYTARCVASHTPDAGNQPLQVLRELLAWLGW